MAELPPSLEMAILQIPTLTAHMRQTKCWQIYHPPEMVVILEIPTLTAHIRQTKCWEIYPSKMVIIDSYSESSYLADQVLADQVFYAKHLLPARVTFSLQQSVLKDAPSSS